MPAKAAPPFPVFPHIYVTDEDKLLCYDNVGFAAIGMGKSHAESQFMFSGYWRVKPFNVAVFTAYMAKKRAEVAPGVGEDTDIVLIEPVFGLAHLAPEHVDTLTRIYKKYYRRLELSLKRAEDETQKHIERAMAEAQKKQQQNQPASTPSTSQTSAGQS